MYEISKIMIKIIAKIVLISFLFSFKMAEEPLGITWKNLKDVRFKKKYFEEVGMVFLVPYFGESVKKLEGKEVTIKGYMIPTDVSGDNYVISANPMSSCFFCGGSGPESMVEINFKKKKNRFKMDEIRTIKGVLKLNEMDIEHMNFILNKAEIIDE